MKKSFILVLMSLVFTSCSRDENGSENTPNLVTESSLVPVSISIESDKPRTNTLFIYSTGNLLQTIEYPDYNSGEMYFSYNEQGLISKVVLNAPRNGNPAEEKGIFTYDSNKNLIREEVTHTTQVGRTEIVINYEIKGTSVTAKRVEKDYENDGSINYTEESVITYTLDSQKRPYKIHQKISFSATGGTTQTYENQIDYSYHSDDYIYKNITGFKSLTYSEYFFNAPNAGVYFGAKSYKSSLKENYNYRTETTNNSSNYPNKIILFDNKEQKIQTYSIEYK